MLTFDPRLHPRDREGKFRDVLRTLKLGQQVKLPSGVTVSRDAGSKFRIGSGGRYVSVKDVDSAVKNAFSEHDTRPERSKGLQRAQSEAQDRHRRLHNEQVAKDERVMGSDAAVAVGRFNKDGTEGYKAAGWPDAKLRKKRETAVEDQRKWLEMRHRDFSTGDLPTAKDLKYLSDEQIKQLVERVIPQARGAVGDPSAPGELKPLIAGEANRRATRRRNGPMPPRPGSKMSRRTGHDLLIEGEGETLTEALGTRGIGQWGQVMRQNQTLGFNPSLHPRDREGKFAAALNKLVTGSHVQLPNGVKVSKVHPGAGRGFAVRVNGRDVAGDRLSAAQALKLALHHHDKQKAKSLIEAELTAQKRGKLPKSAFAIPPDRYPIHDEAHARNALSRVAQHGTEDEKRRVRAAVKRRYPKIGLQEALTEAVAERKAAQGGSAFARARAREQELREQLARLEESVSVGYHFNPHLHPRNRVGEFVDVLSKLRSSGHGADVGMPGGIVVGRRRGRFEVHVGGKRIEATHSPDKAASVALAAFDVHRGGHSGWDPSVKTGRVAVHDEGRVMALRQDKGDTILEKLSVAHLQVGHEIDFSKHKGVLHVYDDAVKPKSPRPNVGSHLWTPEEMARYRKENEAYYADRPTEKLKVAKIEPVSRSAHVARPSRRGGGGFARQSRDYRITFENGRSITTPSQSKFLVRKG